MHTTSIRSQETNATTSAEAVDSSIGTATDETSSAAERLGPLADVVRRAYFGECAESASRFGVTLDEVFEHCEAAFDLDLLDTPLLRRAASERIAAHLDDLILAIACIADDFQAWFEFESELQLSLARMCELRVGEIEASLQASRYLRDVRERTRRVHAVLDDEDEDDGTPTLHEYTGLQPLRSFLGGPLFAMLQDLIRDGLVEAVRPGAEPERRRLRLAD